MMLSSILIPSLNLPETSPRTLDRPLGVPRYRTA
jgi:hypothetical protein